jgi:hypothetical protein
MPEVEIHLLVDFPQATSDFVGVNKVEAKPSWI